jgi:NTE family protein
MKIRSALLAILLIFISSGFLQAQKVGLVLSGGGAKGVAHIGVIRALEENGVPIDYVTGTSMGAIIGALYATGYSPDEMEEIVRSEEFAGWVSGDVDAKYSYLFKKPTTDASWAEFKFRIDSVFTPFFPTNIVSPILMDFAFLEVFAGAGAASRYNFDSLMVPFRCMASDISRGEAVVLHKGDLGSAVRASMTFPFFFRPIRIDGKLLFDGGMYNNFPTDVMYDDFFPDIIIGSQVAANYQEPKDDNIVSQLQNMLMQKQEYSAHCENGVVIRPNLREVNVIDFSNTTAFIDSGYAMAKRSLPYIREFVVERVSQEEIKAKRMKFENSKPPLLVGDLKISGLKSGQYEYVNQLLGIRPRTLLPADKNDDTDNAGIPLSMIKPQYFKLIAEDKIEHIYPQMRYDTATGLFDLILDVQRENQLVTGIGGAVTSSSVNELFLKLQYNYWTRYAYQANINAYFGRFYNSSMIEGRMDIPGSKPFFLKARFTFNKFNYFKTNTYFFEDEDPFFLVERERFFTLSGGIPLKNNGIFSIDMIIGRNRDDYFQTNYYTRSDTLDRTGFNFFSPGVSLEINTLNRKEYASRGIRFSAESRLVTGREIFTPGSAAPFKKSILNDHTWLQVNVTYENFYKRISSVSLGVFAQAYFSSQEYFSNYTSSILSAKAYQPFPEAIVRFMPQFRANRFVALGSKNVLDIRKNVDFRMEAHVFVPFRAIQQDYLTREAKRADEIFVYGMGSAALVYHSPIGPVSLNLNYFYGENNPYSFFMKFGYLIFNKRPF